MDSQADNFYLNGKFKNNFIKLGNISSGGYGFVIKARHLNKTYAIKLIPFENDESIERVMKEIKILSSLKSEYVIEYVSSWLEDNTALNSDLFKSLRDSKDISPFHPVFYPNNKYILFVQMELGHRTLEELIKSLKVKFNEKDENFLKPISYFIASEIFKEILECVNYLHNHSPPIIHRDLKPKNILITNGIDGRFVKIGDFGLATLHEFVDQSHTEEVGHIKYIAPELLRNSKYDTKSDVYSLGVILEELFNFDFYGDFHSDEPDIDPVLTQKYSKLTEIFEKMVSIVINLRPNCEEILNTNLFMVESEIKYLTGIEEFLKPIHYYTDNFFELLIQTKIKHPNYKLAIESINKLSYFIETLNNGRYEQVFEEFSILGKGGFSVVCEAKSRFDNNFYAIKKIPIIYKSDNIKQIRREWHLMEELIGDNFVKYISAWTEENLFKESDMNKYRENGVNHTHPIFFKEHKLVLYIQMELCYDTLDGVRSELNEQLNPPNNQLDINLLGYYVRSEILLEIFDAIQFIHARNIIHRDLKPTNILISNTDLNGKFVKIADFGSAKLIASLTQLNTKGSGNSFYRAPEVFSGKYNTTADIYSLGLTTMDWFNTDISDNSVGNINDNIIERYNMLMELCEKMIVRNPNNRPNWDEINASKSSWILNIKDIQNTVEIAEIRRKLNEVKYPHSFYLKFMETRIRKFKKIPISNNESIVKKMTTNIVSAFENNFPEKKVIGNGSFAVVYKVKDKNNIMFAIKRIPVEEKHSKEISEKLKIITNFKNDYIIKYESIWIEPNQYSKIDKSNSEIPNRHLVFNVNLNSLINIQMKLCDETLQSFINKLNQELNNNSKIRYYIANELFYEILNGVNYLHNRTPPIIHSNLNLTNILISLSMDGKFIKISDIGNFIYKDHKEVILQSHISKKSKYIAPELFSGISTLNIESDLYSLGIIIEDLLNFDQTRQPNIIEDETLKSKYDHLISLYKKMTIDVRVQPRPTIDDILREKCLWAFNFSDVVDQTLSEELREINFSSEKVHLKFLQIKQIHSK